MINRIPAINDWWLKKRLSYNKGLLFTGLLGFTAQALQQCFIPDKMLWVLLNEMQLSGVLFLIFLVLANIAFTTGSLLDLLFNHDSSPSFRDWLYSCGYWFAIMMLILCIVACLLLA